MLKKYAKIVISLLCMAVISGCGGATTQSIEDTSVVEQAGITNEEEQDSGQESEQREEEPEKHVTESLTDDSQQDILSDGTSAKEEESVTGTLQVHFMDVGQGDSILVSQGEHHMLIDAGENDCGTKVQSYLNSQNVDHLDYIVGTHPDSDHIGGLDVVIYKFDCDHVLLSSYGKNTRTYDDVLMALKEKGKQPQHPVAGEQFSLGEASVTVLSPKAGADYGEESNDYSIALKVIYGENSFLFTGDCEEEAENDMLFSGMDLTADVMKAAHHGSNSSNTEGFLQAVSPKSVVISCGEGNEYGHPRAEVLNNLRSMGVSVYRTDEQGTIVASSDGKEITWNTSPSDTWQAGEPKGSGESSKDVTESNKTVEDTGTQGEEQQQAEVQVEESAVNAATQNTQDYILNTNTKKFHYPNCSSVDQMSEKNKRLVNDTAENIRAMGYEPCKRCNP